jgi:hypothetical protein
MQKHLIFSKPFLILILSSWLLAVSILEFEKIAWGSGIWLGQFSFKWALAFFTFVLFCVFCLSMVVISLWFPPRLLFWGSHLAKLRNRFGGLRWVLVILALIAPVWLLQYTFYGAVIDGPYLRILLWMLSAFFTAVLLTWDSNRLIIWPSLLVALVLTSGVFNFVTPLRNVTDYPFSLGWSEGNRLWDYSVLFGRNLYVYPADQPIPVLLDIGRQSIGGIPFFFPGLTIWQARLWLGFVNIVPYLVLGWVAFQVPKQYFFHWLIAGIWAFTFVRQGPIHPPLLLSAIGVALAWGRSLWIAVPLVMISGYFAQASRFTWMFAPGMWAGMLELSGVYQQGNPGLKNWLRAISVGLAGLFGGYFAPRLVPALMGWVTSFLSPQSSNVPAGVEGGVAISSAGDPFVQPLIWYRLFPNATYEYGILIGLLFAVAPLAAVLIYLSATRRWRLTTWQKPGIILPLIAFLVVGLIVSVKIGGGGDLHNMDMFMIGILFAAATAWRNGGREWIEQAVIAPVWVRSMVLLLIVFPGYQPLMNLAPISIADNVSAVTILADILPTDPAPETLPTTDETRRALDRIRREVQMASAQGDVLFMDQRQLLTFGYIEGVQLVPEYDKKVLINQAMSEDAQYFQGFYHDLASQRFSLIVSHPLHMRFQTESDNFGEENNAWVKWVSRPVLCYYEPQVTLRKVTVQLLIPRQDLSDCDPHEMLPTLADE